MRNGFASADYDSRAYDSLVVPQRYWQRRRYQIVTEMAGADPNRLDIGCGSSRIIQNAPESVGMDIEQAMMQGLGETTRYALNGEILSLYAGDRLVARFEDTSGITIDSQ